LLNVIVNELAQSLCIYGSAVQPALLFFFSITRLPPTSTLFPYTTLFRSTDRRRGGKRFDHDRDTQAPGPQRIAERGLSHQVRGRSEEHTSELQSLAYLVCRLLLEKKKIAA